ncbi:unnamed protein product, partial [Protopolystoma xenopodis]
ATPTSPSPRLHNRVYQPRFRPSLASATGLRETAPRSFPSPTNITGPPKRLSRTTPTTDGQLRVANPQSQYLRQPHSPEQTQTRRRSLDASDNLYLSPLKTSTEIVNASTRWTNNETEAKQGTRYSERVSHGQWRPRSAYDPSAKLLVLV